MSCRSIVAYNRKNSRDGWQFVLAGGPSSWKTRYARDELLHLDGPAKEGPHRTRDGKQNLTYHRKLMYDFETDPEHKENHPNPKHIKRHAVRYRGTYHHWCPFPQAEESTPDKAPKGESKGKQQVKKRTRMDEKRATKKAKTEPQKEAMVKPSEKEKTSGDAEEVDDKGRQEDSGDDGERDRTTDEERDRREGGVDAKARRPAAESPRLLHGARVTTPVVDQSPAISAASSTVPLGVEAKHEEMLRHVAATAGPLVANEMRVLSMWIRWYRERPVFIKKDAISEEQYRQVSLA